MCASPPPAFCRPRRNWALRGAISSPPSARLWREITSEKPNRSLFTAYETSYTELGLGLQWDLDFWGKYRRATEAARDELLANNWVRQQVTSSLVADVASAYFMLRALDLQLHISQRTLASDQDSLRLTQLLSDHGATSLLDVRQAEQLVYNASGAIASHRKADRAAGRSDQHAAGPEPR